MKIAILAPNQKDGLYCLNHIIDSNEDIFINFYGNGAKDVYKNEYYVCTSIHDIAGLDFDQAFYCGETNGDTTFKDFIWYFRTNCLRNSYVPEDYQIVKYEE